MMVINSDIRVLCMILAFLHTFVLILFGIQPNWTFRSTFKWSHRCSFCWLHRVLLIQRKKMWIFLSEVKTYLNIFLCKHEQWGVYDSEEEMVRCQLHVVPNDEANWLFGWGDLRWLRLNEDLHSQSQCGGSDYLVWVKTCFSLRYVCF